MDIQSVAELVAACVFNTHDAKLLNHTKLQTPSSLVFRLEYKIGAATETLFIKFPAKNKDKKQREKIIQRLQREYDIAQVVKSLFKETDELKVVSPAAYLDEIHGLVTWEVQGASLQDMISPRLRFRYQRRDTTLTRLSELAGEWLRRFHSLDLAAGDTDFIQDISSYCEGRLDALVLSEKSRISETFAEALKSNISVWIEEALSAPGARIILCHNDYSPHNIIVTDKGICVLDFSFSSPGLPAFDLACFWHKIEDLKGSLIHGKKSLEEIQNAFLQGYGATFDLARPDIKLGLTRLILSKMLTLLGTGHKGLPGWIENRRRYSTYLRLLESGFDSPNH